MRLLPGPADDRAADPHRRDRGLQVEVAQADREQFSDAGGGAQDDFEDLAQLLVRARARDDLPVLPCPDRAAHRTDLLGREGVHFLWRSAQAGDVVHRVARDELVTDGESERESHDVARLPGTVVALLGELLDEVVAARHPDLSQAEVLEEREHEGAHVAFVEDPRRFREAVLDVHVLDPVVHESTETRIGVHPGEGWLEQGPLGQFVLQQPLCRRAGVGSALDCSRLAIPIAIPSPGRVAATPEAIARDPSMGADRGTGPSHSRARLPARAVSAVSRGRHLLLCCVFASDQLGNHVAAPSQPHRQGPESRYRRADRRNRRHGRHAGT